jgi:hypothetical protein
MQALKVKKKLMRIPGAHSMLSRINVVFQTTKTFILVMASRDKSTTSYEATKGYRAHQLETERIRAKTEEFTQSLQRRII